MLQGAVVRSFSIVVLAGVTLAACGGDDGGGVIEENVVRPGITAMEQAGTLACGTDEATVRQAVEMYETLEGSPPADEAAIVAAGYLRGESQLWDVVDGELVAAVPECGAANTITAPATEVGEIVTSTEEPLTAEEMFAQLTADDIAQVGGEECARELTEIFAASERYFDEQATGPASLDQLVESGYLDLPVTLWQVLNDELVPAAGSTCIAPTN